MGTTVSSYCPRRGAGLYLRDLLAKNLVCLLLVGSIGCTSSPPGMVLIPAGDFIMGTDEVDTQKEAIDFGFPAPWYEDEHPQHRVFLQAYYIDRFEVTNGAYKAFVDETGHQIPDHWTTGTFPDGHATDPVVFVDWFSADAYCRWAGKRLPTEAEWEKAARGSQGRKYPWGEKFEMMKANLSQGPGLPGQIAPVGSFPEGQSPYGVHDMTGNVWEWTDSWYLPYPGNKVSRPEFGMKYRVTRGLSFVSLGHYPEEEYHRIVGVYARASSRWFDDPTARLPDLGFRCAR